MNQIWIVLGSVFAFLSVAFGAFGAHGLEGKLEPRMLTIWETAARYQMYHSLALIGLGIWATQNTASSTSVSGYSFVAGILLFSGSLYALALTGVKVLGAITPLGGMAFMIAWIAFAVTAWRA